jgi:hypothetical protein
MYTPGILDWDPPRARPAGELFDLHLTDAPATGIRTEVQSKHRVEAPY